MDNLVLEHLRHIRGKIDKVSDDMGDFKKSISSLENSMLTVRREVNDGEVSPNEIAKAIRADIAEMKSDIKENTQRLGRVEFSIAGLRRDMALT